MRSIFGEPVGDFQAEGDGLGVHAVGAADLRSGAKFLGAGDQSVAKFHERGFDKARGFADLQGLRGVDHVVGGHAVVEPAGGGGIADGFADSHGESDDVMLHARFEFVDTRDVNFGVGANFGGGFFGDFASFRERFRGGQLNFEPLGEFVGVAPDGAHLFAGVAWNQLWLLILSTRLPGTTSKTSSKTAPLTTKGAAPRLTP